MKHRDLEIIGLNHKVTELTRELKLERRRAELAERQVRDIARQLREERASRAMLEAVLASTGVEM